MPVHVVVVAAATTTAAAAAAAAVAGRMMCGSDDTWRMIGSLWWWWRRRWSSCCRSMVMNGWKCSIRGAGCRCYYATLLQVAEGITHSCVLVLNIEGGR